ncbi:hypothetical protein KR009_007896 [Drosophila setifemur]|nr:hypothetical protein KR009_007896 [Drosophila setifemur]
MSRLFGLSSMLLLLLVCLGASGTASAKPHEEVTKDRAAELAHECQAETGATDEDVEHLLGHERPETRESKCLRACVMKKFGMVSADPGGTDHHSHDSPFPHPRQMDEAGKLDKEHAEELIKIIGKVTKDGVAAEVADKCVLIEAPEDHCDAAFAYESCIGDQLKEHGIEMEEH